MTVATVMTWNRKRVEVEVSWMEANASLLGFVKATDGVWVPACDLSQYESGNRSFDDNVTN